MMEAAFGRLFQPHTVRLRRPYCGRLPLVATLLLAALRSLSGLKKRRFAHVHPLQIITSPSFAKRFTLLVRESARITPDYTTDAQVRRVCPSGKPANDPRKKQVRGACVLGFLACLSCLLPRPAQSGSRAFLRANDGLVITNLQQGNQHENANQFFKPNKQNRPRRAGEHRRPGIFKTNPENQRRIKMTVFVSYQEALNASLEDMQAAQQYAAWMVPEINAARAAGRELVSGQLQFLEDVARYQSTVPPTRLQRVRRWVKSKLG